MKIVFYAFDGAAAKERVTALRAAKEKVTAVDVFAVREAISADAIEFMPDVPPFEKARIASLLSAPIAEAEPDDAGGNEDAKRPAAKDPFNELDQIDDWREFQARKLIRIAAAITGRTASDKSEAVAMIEEALAKRNAGNVPPPPPA